jgi:hypothetical protein
MRRAGDLIVIVEVPWTSIGVVLCWNTPDVRVLDRRPGQSSNMRVDLSTIVKAMS